MGVVIRQSIKATSVHYVGVVIGIFVTFFLMTKCFKGHEEVIGLTGVMYEIAYILSTLALFGSGSSGMRFFPYFKDEKTGHHGFFYFYRALPLFGIVFFSTLFLLFKEPITLYFSEKSPLLNDHFYYVLPLFWVLTGWVFFENFANIFMRIAIPKVVREIVMRLFQAGIFVAFYYEFLGATGVVIAYIACYGLCMLTTAIYSCRIGCTETRHDWNFITPELRNRFLKYTGFLMIAAISSCVMNMVDKVMLGGMKGLYDVGVYSIVIYMAEVINMPSRSITPISSPLAAEAMKEGDLQKAQMLFRQVSVHQMLASSILLLIVWVNLDNIYLLIPGGMAYAVGKTAVLYQGIGRVFSGTLNFGNQLLSFSKYYYWTLVIAVVLAVLSIYTNLYFIPRLGLTGAALATLISLALSNILLQTVVSCALKCHPFSWAHLRILIIVGILFGLNMMIPEIATPDDSWWLVCIDIALRSSILCIIALVLIYYLHVSDQVNGIIDKYIGTKK